MWRHVGLVRSEAGLQEALDGIHDLLERCPAQAGEVHNMLTASRVIAEAAQDRRESRGGHYRIDHPTPLESLETRHRFVATQD